MIKRKNYLIRKNFLILNGGFKPFTYLTEYSKNQYNKKFTPFHPHSKDPFNRILDFTVPNIILHYNDTIELKLFLLNHYIDLVSLVFNYGPDLEFDTMISIEIENLSLNKLRKLRRNYLDRLID